MQSPDSCSIQEKLSKRAKIGSITETPRSDRNQIPKGFQCHDCRRQKCRVEIRSLNTECPSCLSVPGRVADLEIRRIHDDCVNCGPWKIVPGIQGDMRGVR